MTDNASSTVKLTRRIEFWLLIALILFVPLLEAPKNVVWLCYLLLWLFNRVGQRKKGEGWDLWDGLIAIWVFSGFIGGAFAGLHFNEWREPLDVVRYGLLLWAVKRSGYTQTDLRRLVWMVAASTLIALAFGLWCRYVAHTTSALQLNSVGHVNHSAIYLVISFGVALAYTFAYWREMRCGWQIGWSLINLLFVAGILLSASRAAVGMIPLLSIGLALVWCRRSPRPLLAVVIAGMLIGVFAIGTRIEVVIKHEYNVETNNVLSYRGQIWESAITAWRKYPLFGVGMGNFGEIDARHVKQWSEELGEPFDSSRYLQIAHAHSLYFNTLAERGLFGATVLAAIMLTWLFGLIHRMPFAKSDNLTWLLWGGSLSAWLTTVVIGTVNTTLHHEHGMLSGLLLGAWLASRRYEIKSDEKSSPMHG